MRVLGLMKAGWANTARISVSHANIGFLRAGNSKKLLTRQAGVLWDIPGTTLAVSIPAEVATKISLGLAHPKTHNDVTGIVFGRFEINGSRTLITIDLFRPVDALSPDDLSLEELLSKRIITHQRPVIGLYTLRNNRDANHLPHTLALFAHYFRDSENIFVAFERSATGRLIADVFLRGSVRFLVNEPSLTFAINSFTPPLTGAAARVGKKIFMIVALILFLAAAALYEKEPAITRSPQFASLRPSPVIVDRPEPQQPLVHPDMQPKAAGTLSALPRRSPPPKKFVLPVLANPQRAQVQTEQFNLSQPVLPIPQPPSLPIQIDAPDPPRPAIQNDTGSQVTPPSPRRQIAIVVPEYLKRQISRSISVDVHCVVTAKGQVASVTIAPAKVSLQGQLSVLAAAAARDWTFSPARLHGQAVSSEYVITFSFHPPVR